MRVARIPWTFPALGKAEAQEEKVNQVKFCRNNVYKIFYLRKLFSYFDDGYQFLENYIKLLSKVQNSFLEVLKFVCTTGII